MTRKTLILTQAAAITFMAVLGAYGNTGNHHNCTVTIAVDHCD